MIDFIMEVILDTNFIVSCVRRRIDFIEELEKQGFRIKVPKEVIEEMKDIRKDVSRDERIAIDMAFEILDKGKVEKMGLPTMKVDEALIEFGKKGVYIATLDSAIKRVVPNTVSIENASNGIIVERK